MQTATEVQRIRPATLRGMASRIDRGTSADRDRAIDGLRALAIVGVILGHWLVMALVPDSQGGLMVNSPLITMQWLAPVGWVLQMLALFFLVGGYSAARSLAGAKERGMSYGGWARSRLVRLARPVLAVSAVLGLTLPLLTLIGVPNATLRTTAVLVIQPLWFIAVYGVITALTHVAVALVDRLGAWAALPPFVVVAVVDLLRYGPWQDAVPGWLGLLNVVPAWSFAYLLGVAWARGRLGRREVAAFAIGGALLHVLLVSRLGYPMSMVGVPGSGRTNAHPPSLLVVALASAQSGLVILLRDRVAALLAHPKRWAAVALVNLAAMTIFCWHQVALMVTSGIALVVAPGGMAGLHDVPEGPAWLLARVAWLPVYLAMLGGLVLLARRFEAPWTGVPRPVRIAAVGLAASFGAFALAVF